MACAVQEQYTASCSKHGCFINALQDKLAIEEVELKSVPQVVAALTKLVTTMVHGAAPTTCSESFL
jgi:hypothetical protein